MSEIKAGDIVECWPDDAGTLVCAGIVNDAPDKRGYFTVWFLEATAQGEFRGMHHGTFLLSEGRVRKLVREPADPLKVALNGFPDIAASDAHRAANRED